MKPSWWDDKTQDYPSLMQMEELNNQRILDCCQKELSRHAKISVSLFLTVGFFCLLIILPAWIEGFHKRGWVMESISGSGPSERTAQDKPMRLMEGHYGVAKPLPASNSTAH